MPINFKKIKKDITTMGKGGVANPFSNVETEKAKVEALVNRSKEGIKQLNPSVVAPDTTMKQNPLGTTKSGAPIAQKIQFNPDGSVHYQAGDFNQTLTQEEYKQLHDKQVLAAEAGVAPSQLATAPSKVNEALAAPETAQARQNAELASQVGQTQPDNTNIQPVGVNYGEALTTGFGREIPQIATKIASGAGIGALAGAPAFGVGAGVGAAIGAGVGLIAGLYSAVQSNVKQQVQENINVQKGELTSVNKRLNGYIALAKAAKTPQQKADAIDGYNQEISKIQRAYNKLQLETRTNVLVYNDAKEELAAFERFNTNIKPLTDYQMTLAITNPTADIAPLVDYAEENGISA